MKNYGDTFGFGVAFGRPYIIFEQGWYIEYKIYIGPWLFHGSVPLKKRKGLNNDN